MELTLSQFENYSNKDEYEVFDEETKQWVAYNQSCYRQIQYPNIALADKKITAISFIVDDHVYALGLTDFNTTASNVTYFKFTDETALLRGFVSLMISIKPDVFSGWNIEGFDIPYLIRRCYNIIGEQETKKMSPWGMIKEKKIPTMNGMEMDSYDVVGITPLDYMLLYKKFKGETQESYSLGFITQNELSVSKVDYGEYGNLDRLYKENPQLYMEYNIRDVELLPLLENKLKYIDMVYMIAYYTKSLYVDVFKNTRLWDSLIYGFLKRKNKVVDSHQSNDQSDSKSRIAGGHVKLPVGGMYDWVISYDATSLYPHTIMGCNISPETFVKRVGFDVDAFLENIEKKKKIKDIELEIEKLKKLL